MAERSWDRGRYTLVKKLGEGAYKEVFLVWDNLLERDVALCQFNPGALASGYFENIVEAKILAELFHPNIVRFFEIRNDDGWYLIIEYVDGGSLKDKIDAEWSKGVPLPDALKIGIEVADALDYTHEKVVFHRDVKPGNIMLTSGGTAKLSDFGLATPLNTDLNPSDPGAIVGTIPYMSPEQCISQWPDTPADMYSLGVVLYEMTAGRRPFDGDDINVMQHHENTPPPPPSRFNPEIPDRLERLILALLKKKPHLRPSAFETADELRVILRNLNNSIWPKVSEAAQYQSTVVPLFIGGMTLLSMVVLGEFEVPLMVPGISSGLFLGASAASFAWRYRVESDDRPRYNVENSEEASSDSDTVEEDDPETLQATLRMGFEILDASSGVGALDGFVNEYDQVIAIISGWQPEDADDISGLVREVRKQNFDLLNTALEFLNLADASDKLKLEQEIGDLRRLLQTSEEDGGQASGQATQRRRLLAELCQTLDTLTRYEGRAEEYLLRSRRNENSLHDARIKLSLLRADDPNVDIDSIKDDLQNTIDESKDILVNARDLDA